MLPGKALPEKNPENIRKRFPCRTEIAFLQITAEYGYNKAIRNEAEKACRKNKTRRKQNGRFGNDMLSDYFRCGSSRSSYIEAIQKAKAGDFEGAEACMEAGQQEFLKGHEAHFELIQKEAQGVQVGGSLILVHAEDQLMSAEGFKIIAEEMIAAYKRIAELEKKVN